MDIFDSRLYPQRYEYIGSSGYVQENDFNYVHITPIVSYGTNE